MVWFWLFGEGKRLQQRPGGLAWLKTVLEGKARPAESRAGDTSREAAGERTAGAGCPGGGVPGGGGEMMPGSPAAASPPPRERVPSTFRQGRVSPARGSFGLFLFPKFGLAASPAALTPPPPPTLAVPARPASPRVP